ncbi:MAG: thioredoxin [Candidatus Bathyarchaeia archaeon]
MSDEREGFISVEDKELKRIREKKIKQLVKQLEEKEKMAVKPVHVTDSNFDDIIHKHSLVLIDFWADWCAPCRMIAPIIEELAREYAGKVLVGKINVDENPETAERFQIFSIPTILVMKNGEEIDRIVGLVPKNQIEEHLKKHLE